MTTPSPIYKNDFDITLGCTLLFWAAELLDSKKRFGSDVSVKT